MGKAIKQENNLVTFLQFHLGDSAFRKSEIDGFLKTDAFAAPAEHSSIVSVCSQAVWSGSWTDPSYITRCRLTGFVVGADHIP